MKGCSPVLFFGAPGTGKSVFPFYIANDLNRNFSLNFSLVFTRCDQLVKCSKGIEEAIAQLERMFQLADKNQPVIVVFDEVDSLMSPIEGSGKQTALLTKWLREYVREGPERILSVFITHHPHEMDFSVMRHIRVSLFFEMTPPETIDQIVGDVLRIDNFHEVGYVFRKELDKIGVVPLASDVVMACHTLETGGEKPHASTAQAIGKQLALSSSGLPREYLERYEETYRDLIARSRTQMSYWASESERPPKSEAKDLLVQEAKAEIGVEQAVVDLFAEPRDEEIAILGRVAYSRLRAISRLKLEIDRQKNVDERILQKIIEDAPWLLNPQWTVFGMCETFETVRERFEKWFEHQYHERLVTSVTENDRLVPDFVLLNPGKRLEIVEIKKRWHVFGDKEYERLQRYVDGLDEFLKIHKDFQKEFGDKCHITLICDDIRLNSIYQRAFNSLKADGRLELIPWNVFLVQIENAQRDFIAALRKKS